jgi:hypothetical protein
MGSKSLKSTSIFCVIAAILMVVGPQATRAQQIDQYLTTNIPGFNVEPGVTVASRLRPDFDYPGIRFGDILVRPEFAESAGYDGNVAGTQSAHGSSFLETQGAVTVNSDWARDSFMGALTADNDKYFDLASQSYTNWSGSLGGTRDIGLDTLSAGYVHLNLNQTARDLNAPQLDSPIAYRVDDLRINYKSVFSVLSLQPGIEVARYDYDDGSVLGQPYLQTYRDRIVVTPSLTASYEFAPLRSLVLVVSDADARYTDQPAGVATRNFNDISVLAGINYDTGGLIRVRALAGYETRHFTSTQYPTISSPIVEASAAWTPTGLTTITGTFARYIEDSASEATVGLTSTTVRVAVDHEYLRNVLLNATAGFIANSYEQDQGNQSYLTVGAGVTWLINQHMRLIGHYDFATRQSNATAGGLGSGQTLGGNYSDNRFLLQLRIGL